MHLSKPYRTVIACAAAVALSSLTALSWAASVDATELTQLRREAALYGAVPVMVHLESVQLSALKANRSEIQSSLRTKGRRLFDELGAESWAAGRWDNGAGQVGMIVTAKGLDVLAGSSNAISFFAGQRWLDRTALDGSDRALEALDAAARRNATVDVELTLNVDGLQTKPRADGSRQFVAGAAPMAAAAAEARALFATMEESELRDRSAALDALQALEAAGASGDPRITVRTTLQGLVRLSESTAIRSMRPVGHVDPRPRHVDLSATERARRDGAADVVLVLREAGAGGKLSRASQDAVKRTNRSTFDDLLKGLGPVTKLHDFSEFGAAHVRLTAAQLERLQQSPDARLLAVVDNKPIATTQLAASGPVMNMASAWNAGFRGGGQSVIVFDTGVAQNHPFVAGRVTFEACFGTNQFQNGIQYLSVCPQANAAGDSPLGLVGSAAPAFGGNCSTSSPGSCTHGAHVSGISSGRLAPNQNAGLQGTAPDSNIIAVQVFSFDQARAAAPTVFFVDLLAALQAAANAMAPNLPGSNPFTVNMSLGGGQNAGPCNAAQWAPYITAVQTLRNAGVPVIAATGNDGFDAAISLPACLPGVVKVGSVGNDGIGNTRSFFNPTQASNVANPAAFPGETFWIAPGGGNGTAVQSSVVGGGFAGMSGTSMAAPQIAGLYADAKSANPAFTVNDITAYFIGNASVDVPMRARSGAPLNFNLRRIRLPAL